MSLHTPPLAVAQLREQHLALQSEYALMKREVQLGYLNEHALEPVVQKMSDTEIALCEKEKQWQEELALVQKLFQTREVFLNNSESVTLEAESESSNPLHNAPIEGQLADDEQREKLSFTINKLACFQSEDASVYAQVDDSVSAAIVADWTGIPVGRMVQ